MERGGRPASRAAVPDGRTLVSWLITGEKARRLAAAGRLRDAADLLDPITQESEADPRLLDLAARVYAQMGRFGAARTLWSRAAAKDPGNTVYAHALRRCERALQPGIAGSAARRSVPAVATTLVVAVACVVAFGVRDLLRTPAREAAVEAPVKSPVTAPVEASTTAPIETPQAGAPSPIQGKAEEVLRKTPGATAVQIAATDAGVLVVSGQVETLWDRFVVERELAGIAGVAAIDMSRVRLAPFYTVRQGDTLWSISVLLYGRPSMWKDLADANGLVFPHAIHPGDQLRVPWGDLQN